MNQEFKTCRRYNIPGHAHELTFSCFKALELLEGERTCRLMLKSLGNARVRHDFHIWAWVIMPEHVHLLIYPTCQTYSIPDILRSIKQPVSRKTLVFARKYQPSLLEALKTGMKSKPYQFWQAGGGYDRNLTSPKAIMNSVNYIHNNPVRRGLVESPQDWLWSSARDWMGVGEGLVPIDREFIPFA